MSRKPTTGRYQTREALEKAVWTRYHTTPATIGQVAKATGISEATARKILDKKGQS